MQEQTGRAGWWRVSGCSATVVSSKRCAAPRRRAGGTWGSSAASGMPASRRRMAGTAPCGRRAPKPASAAAPSTRRTACHPLRQPGRRQRQQQRSMRERRVSAAAVPEGPARRAGCCWPQQLRLQQAEGLVLLPREQALGPSPADPRAGQALTLAPQAAALLPRPRGLLLRAPKHPPAGLAPPQLLPQEQAQAQAAKRQRCCCWRRCSCEPGCQCREAWPRRQHCLPAGPALQQRASPPARQLARLRSCLAGC